jgi:hypothetical protein
MSSYLTRKDTENLTASKDSKGTWVKSDPYIRVAIVLMRRFWLLLISGIFVSAARDKEIAVLLQKCKAEYGGAWGYLRLVQLGSEKERK